MPTGIRSSTLSSSALDWVSTQGVVRVDRRVFRHLLGEPATPARCIELYHLQRTEFERAAEEKLKRRELADDGNIELSGRDLRRNSSRSR